LKEIAVLRIGRRSTMNTEENKRIVFSFFENANKGNIDASLELLSDGLIWTGVGTSRFSGTYNGKEKVLQDLIGPLFSSLKQGIYSTVENMIAEGNRVVVQATGKAETLDGKEYNNTYCFVFKIEEGKICEVVEYCDTALINEVFG
jgi:ketosteroid isomerase-like protein